MNHPPARDAGPCSPGLHDENLEASVLPELHLHFCRLPRAPGSLTPDSIPTTGTADKRPCPLSPWHIWHAPLPDRSIQLRLHLPSRLRTPAFPESEVISSLSHRG